VHTEEAQAKDGRGKGWGVALGSTKRARGGKESHPWKARTHASKRSEWRKARTIFWRGVKLVEPQAHSTPNRATGEPGEEKSAEHNRSSEEALSDGLIEQEDPGQRQPIA